MVVVVVMVVLEVEVEVEVEGAVAVERSLERESGVGVIGSDKITKFYHERPRPVTVCF